MADYPKNIPDVRDALLAFSLPSLPQGVDQQAWDAIAAKMDEAQAHASPVSQIVATFDALKGQLEHLGPSGAELVAGCAHLIAANAWHGKGDEALTVRDAALARIAELA